MDERSRHRQFEDQFFAQLQARALALTGRALPANRVRIEPTSEGVDALRDTLRRLEVFDRNAVETLPGSRAAQFRFERVHLGGLLWKTIARVRVRVLTPTEELVGGRSPGPIGAEPVRDALARYAVLPHGARPTGVVLASPTGFTPEARRLAEMSGPPTLVLLGQRADGGWDVDMPRGLTKTPWARLFELESQPERLRRLMAHLEDSGLELDTRGVAIDELAQKAGLPVDQTEALVRQACRAQPKLMTLVHDGRLHVVRTPLAQEGETMSIWSRIRRWMGARPTVAERVREMTARRVALEQERRGIDKSIDALEAQERDALAQGAAAASDAERKQAAGKLMRLRRDLSRVRSQANIYTQQIDILGTHIHHLTLTEQGRRLELPAADELTREAAQAEAVMGELSANADLARSIEVQGASPMMAEEELAIMEEFKQVAASKSGAAAAATGQAAGAGQPAGASEAARAAGSGRAPATPAAAGGSDARVTPPPVPERGKAKPEVS